MTKPAVSFAPSLLILSIAFVWTSVTSAGPDKRSSSLGHSLQSEYYPDSGTSGQQFWKRLVSSMFAPQPQLRQSPSLRSGDEEEEALDEGGLGEFGGLQSVGSKMYGEKEAPGFYQPGDKSSTEEEEEEDMKRARQLEMFERSLGANSAFPQMKRGRHIMNCQRFKTFGQGYSGLC